MGFHILLKQILKKRLSYLAENIRIYVSRISTLKGGVFINGKL